MVSDHARKKRTTVLKGGVPKAIKIAWLSVHVFFNILASAGAETDLLSHTGTSQMTGSRRII